MSSPAPDPIHKLFADAVLDSPPPTTPLADDPDQQQVTIVTIGGEEAIAPLIADAIAEARDEQSDPL